MLSRAFGFEGATVSSPSLPPTLGIPTRSIVSTFTGKLKHFHGRLKPAVSFHPRFSNRGFHHISYKTGGVRGSTAIKANVSEVWHLTRDNRLAPTQRLLNIEKSRSGCSGLFQLQLDVDDYSWQHQGEFDPTVCYKEDGRDRPPASLPLRARLLNFLEEHPGVPFEAEELVSEFGSNRETIRKTLDRLWRSGLVATEERTKTAGKGTTKYKVYLVAELSQRLEPASNEGLSAGTTSEVALGQTTCLSASQNFVPAPKPSSSEDLEALGQTEPDPVQKILKVGDRVIITMAGSKYEGQTGIVRRVFVEPHRTVVTVQPDGSKQRVDYALRDLELPSQG